MRDVAWLSLLLIGCGSPRASVTTLASVDSGAPATLYSPPTQVLVTRELTKILQLAPFGSAGVCALLETNEVFCWPEITKRETHVLDRKDARALSLPSPFHAIIGADPFCGKADVGWYCRGSSVKNDPGFDWALVRDTSLGPAQLPDLFALGGSPFMMGFRLDDSAASWTPKAPEESLVMRPAFQKRCARESYCFGANDDLRCPILFSASTKDSARGETLVRVKLPGIPKYVAGGTYPAGKGATVCSLDTSGGVRCTTSKSARDGLLFPKTVEIENINVLLAAADRGEQHFCALRGRRAFCRHGNEGRWEETWGPTSFLQLIAVGPRFCGLRETGDVLCAEAR